MAEEASRSDAFAKERQAAAGHCSGGASAGSGDGGTDLEPGIRRCAAYGDAVGTGSAAQSGSVADRGNAEMAVGKKKEKISLKAAE